MTPYLLLSLTHLSLILGTHILEGENQHALLHTLKGNN